MRAPAHGWDPKREPHTERQRREAAVFAPSPAEVTSEASRSTGYASCSAVTVESSSVEH
jgi:hypothetical protein